ncbi:UDP binding domain-containing protein [Lentzea sp. NPDC005914]|uniref:UDP-glucose dehydrogenase family protein n=1 Tax=Lentzea sp. NPDC005914 TaxID=3154572 RepID=UPI0033FD6C06
MFARRIAVVGTGYVGLTTGACLASLGHRVVCADVDSLKVARLRAGQVDILEPGLAELVVEGQAAGRLEFVVGAAGAVADAEVVFLCLPTPMGAGGAADLSAVESVAAEISEVLPYGAVIVTKSTVPVGTSGRVSALLGREDVAVVSNPEFLREGTAVRDFLHPDRIVVGSDSPSAAERVAALFAKLGAPTCGGTLAGVRIGVLGLAFKAGTNDLRDSPALAVAEQLVLEGAELTAFDPEVTGPLAGMLLVDDPYQAVKGAEAVVLLTDWPMFRTLDWVRVAELMDGHVVVDSRNHLDADALLRAGLLHSGVGRASLGVTQFS